VRIGFGCFGLGGSLRSLFFSDSGGILRGHFESYIISSSHAIDHTRGRRLSKTQIESCCFGCLDCLDCFGWFGRFDFIVLSVSAFAVVCL
jgi:hypothetical protein